MFYKMILYGIIGLVSLYTVLANLFMYSHTKEKSGGIVVKLGRSKSKTFYIWWSLVIIFLLCAISEIAHQNFENSFKFIFVGLIILSLAVQGNQLNYVGENGIGTPQGFISWKEVYNYNWNGKILTISYFKLENKKVAYQKKFKVEDTQIEKAQFVIKKNIRKKEIS